VEEVDEGVEKKKKKKKKKKKRMRRLESICDPALSLSSHLS